MFRRILVPIDGSPTSRRGLDEAIALAKDQAARIGLLHVVDERVVTQSFDATLYVPANYVDDVLNALRNQGRRLLARSEARIRKARIKVEPILVETLGRGVAETILAQAKKWKADVIVLGTHGRRGVSRLVLGSDAEEVVCGARVPVLLVRSLAATRTRRASKK
jgi:nucleotide-binding universal stress UspA family protein